MASFLVRPLSRLLDRVAQRFGQRTLDRLERSSLTDRIAFQAAAEVLLARLDDAPPHVQFGGVSDEFWFWLATEGCRRHAKLRAYLPAMPPEDIQLLYTGASGDAVLHEGFEAYGLFRECFEKHVGPLRSDSRVLDFGCGWGRIIRFFLKEIEPAKLHGVDPIREVIDLCKQTNRWCQFAVSPRTPPFDLPAASFDLIYSFSVFSHLSEPKSRELLIEITRLLKPGGLAALTTRSRGFIPFCAKLRTNPKLVAAHEGPQSSALAFPDTLRALADYDAGRYCFHSFNETGEWNYWGETAIPRGYVEREWTHHLEFAEFFDDPQRLPQAVIVMKKPA